ncbi:MAG: hypothetical protein ACLRLD_02370 [Lachnospira sp.]
MNEDKYCKPMLQDLSQNEITNISGGGAVALLVSVGLAGLLLLVAAEYTLVNTTLVFNVEMAVNALAACNID